MPEHPVGPVKVIPFFRFLSLQRKRLLIIVLTMVLVASGLVACTFVAGYRIALDTHRSSMTTLVRSRAAFLRTLTDPHDMVASLTELVQAPGTLEWADTTMEFAVGERQGDSIVVVITRGSETVTTASVPLDSPDAEPMQRALSAQSGTMIGLDYRGHRVLAAYQPVGGGWHTGVVAKIDLAEIRAPFARASFILGVPTIILVSAVAILMLWMGNRRLHDLEQAQEILRHERDLTRQYIDAAGLMLLALDVRGMVTLINPKGCEILGGAREDILGRDWFADFVPKGNEQVRRDVFADIVAGKRESGVFHDDPVVRLDGTARVIAWHDSIIRDAGGAPVGVFASGEDVTERREFDHEVLVVTERERERIGQDLHDVVGQQLAAAALTLRVMEEGARRGTVPTAQRLAEVRAVVATAMARSRFVARGLLPITGGQAGLRDALDDLAANAERLFGISCTLRFAGSGTAMGDATCTHLYHIAEEAITNAVRHGAATSVLVAFDVPDGGITLRIEDNGSGMRDAAPRGPSSGLAIMRARASVIRAQLDIGPGPAGGTQVTCALSASRRRTR